MKHLVSSRLLVPVLPVAAAMSYNHFGKLVFIAQPKLTVVYSAFAALENFSLNKTCKTISLQSRVPNNSITAKPTRR